MNTQPPSPPDPAVPKHFPVVDTLRAVGALAVVTTHVAFWSGDYLRQGVFGAVLARLDVGVAIFFVLSGFLLTRPHLLAAANREPGPGLRAYARSRFWRIYPVYLVTAVLALSVIPENRGLGPIAWLSTATLTGTYSSPSLPHGLTQMWSLEAEVAFYAILPLLMRIGLGQGQLTIRRFAALLLTMLLVSIGWHLWGSELVASRVAGVPGQWLPGFLSWFAAGMALALVDITRSRPHPRRWAQAVADVGRLPGSCWTIAAGSLAVASTPLAGPILLQANTPVQGLTKNLLYLVVGCAVVATGIFADPQSGYGRLFAHRWLRHLGLISYGIFCIHLPIMHAVMAITDWPLFGGNGAALWLVTVLLSVVGAELLYRLVERPASRLRHRAGDSTAAAATSSTAASAR